MNLLVIYLLISATIAVALTTILHLRKEVVYGYPGNRSGVYYMLTSMSKQRKAAYAGLLVIITLGFIVSWPGDVFCYLRYAFRKKEA